MSCECLELTAREIDEVFDQERDLAAQIFGDTPEWMQCDNIALAQYLIDGRNDPECHSLPSDIEISDNDLKNYILFKSQDMASGVAL